MNRPKLWLIREAVVKNTSRPSTDEYDPLDLKALRVSASREGDSQVGAILFIGIATEMGYGVDEISAFEGFEYDEIRFKLSRFRDKIKSEPRFQSKVKLVRNYINLKYAV
jgi:hypothetical protein